MTVDLDLLPPELTRSVRAARRRVVEALFSETRGPSFVWSAAQCTPHRDFDKMNEVSVKNLHKLRRRRVDLDRVVAIDDSPEKHRRNYGNALRVHPWEGDLGDTELDDVRIYSRTTLVAPPSVSRCVLQ